MSAQIPVSEEFEIFYKRFILGTKRILIGRIINLAESYSDLYYDPNNSDLSVNTINLVEQLRSLPRPVPIGYSESMTRGILKQVLEFTKYMPAMMSQREEMPKTVFINRLAIIFNQFLELGHFDGITSESFKPISLEEICQVESDLNAVILDEMEIPQESDEAQESGEPTESTSPVL